jgi:hypothetical protein
VLTGYIRTAMKLNQDGVTVKRLATTIEWPSQGKSRNWKYESR